MTDTHGDNAVERTMCSTRRLLVWIALSPTQNQSFPGIFTVLFFAEILAQLFTGNRHSLLTMPTLNLVQIKLIHFREFHGLMIYSFYTLDDDEYFHVT